MESERLKAAGRKTIVDHPWLALGGSVLTGVLIGAVVSRSPALMIANRLRKRFGGELNVLKDALASVIISGIGDTTKRHFPRLAQEVNGIVQRAKEKVGGITHGT